MSGRILRVVGLAIWIGMAAGAAAVAAPIGPEGARHLLNRTSFAANVEEIDAYAKLTRAEAVDRLLAQANGAPRTPPPDWVRAPFESPRRFREMTPEERKLAFNEMFRQGVDLRAWWVQEMLVTPSPLTEKMVLFWHNHFTSSQQKVRSPQLMYRQHLLLRRHALGNFGEFLHAVAQDPAMVIYLDSASNRKGQPNENFAREVMELFTLGEGHYTERDVKEAARAFTGWSIDPATGEFLFRRMQHDDGVKIVLGRSGNFDGRAVLDILLAQPQTAEHVVSKLWREFVSPVPDRDEVRRIARVFRDSRYDIRSALRAMLTSDAFYAPANRASLIKSPVDLVVGTLRQFRFVLGDVLPFVFTTAQLGQNLFAPPNVKGWPGGEVWINSTTLLARKQLLERLFRVDEARLMGAAMTDMPQGAGRLGGEGRERLLRAMADIQFEGGAWLAQFRGSDVSALQNVVLATAPAQPLPAGASGLDAIRQLVQDPVYQLK